MGCMKTNKYAVKNETEPLKFKIIAEKPRKRNRWYASVVIPVEKENIWSLGFSSALLLSLLQTRYCVCRRTCTALGLKRFSKWFNRKGNFEFLIETVLPPQSHCPEIKPESDDKHWAWSAANIDCQDYFGTFTERVIHDIRRETIIVRPTMPLLIWPSNFASV